VLVRFDYEGLEQRRAWLQLLIPAFVVFAAVVYWYFKIYQSKWRFTSLPELKRILQASTVLALSLLVLDYVLIAQPYFGTFFFGKTTIALYWLLQIFFLASPRIAYRYFKYSRTQHRLRDNQAQPALLLGGSADVDVLIRAIDAGTVKGIRPVGILSPSKRDQTGTIRGIPMLGALQDLEVVVSELVERKIRVARVVLLSSALLPEAKPEETLARCRRLGITVNQTRFLDDASSVTLAPVVVDDLLLRPSVSPDLRRLEGFMSGKSVVVTGGGGSIGSEICGRALTFGADRLLVIENSEPALHAVLQQLAAMNSAAHVEGRIGDIRDRDRMFELIGNFDPDIVFHAAALKHVPILESNWQEGIKTNIFGTINVADAVAATDHASLVLVSTDKAVDPVSVLGLTKQSAELYCQALDREFSHRDNGFRMPRRFVAVRFGNVLASSGSVLSIFKTQIEAGGPVTVTHPDIVRYFMTIREACDLMAIAASHALGPEGGDVSVYVLNMGQPMLIVNLAERLIRLAGLEPGSDIEIKFTGLRPGERLNERLFANDEPTVDIGLAGILAARSTRPSLERVRTLFSALQDEIARDDQSGLPAELNKLVQRVRADGLREHV
jgi:O-antigen biosynthesis protein WbqV